MASREIIVIAVQKDARGIVVTCAFWLTVPTPLVRQAPAFASALPSSTAISWGVTAAELAALQAGTIRELLVEVALPATTTLAAAQAQIASQFADQQNYINGLAPASKFAGMSFDGSTWTAAP